MPAVPGGQYKKTRLEGGFLLAAMDGRHAENAGAFFGCAEKIRL